MEKEILIPEKLDELTLEQWQKIKAVTDKEGVSDEFIVQTILRVVYSIKGDILERIGVKHIDMLLASYREVIEQRPVFQNQFILNGKKYGFIPNLDNITAGELADLDMYAKDVATHHKLMSILFRKVTKALGNDYKIESYKGSNDELKRMPLGIALGAVAFFLDLGKDLTRSMLESLEEENPQLLTRALEKSGVGINPSTLLQEETFCDLMI